jgi:hypothetical protein
MPYPGRDAPVKVLVSSTPSPLALWYSTCTYAPRCFEGFIFLLLKYTNAATYSCHRDSHETCGLELDSDSPVLLPPHTIQLTRTARAHEYLAVPAYKPSNSGILNLMIDGSFELSVSLSEGVD